ncbi:hypothetical protein [Mesorhizobium sp. M6A.T.Ce.TU.016.01.1.1]|uniref:hypothetical protein n=1 Tax=Mesorhizobium sp. M6A.T.Ce.TU.016.01.1.1 TaxID=2496783 RepID=UPI000FCBA8A1|nr:hypothetical protein [Mesorhizobium sp. M6A.T.Ce.TU.016.01.1.1]RUU29735.1 hypothetical protein EOC94_12765 [Mesorhizobium sp. M6A.T.Ce.TU.016.01.1.1]
MTARFSLPLQPVRATSKQTTLLIDSSGKAIGGFYCEQHAELAFAAVAAINAQSDFAALLRQVRREYGTFTKLSGETLIEIDNALAGKAVQA